MVKCFYGHLNCKNQLNGRELCSIKPRVKETPNGPICQNYVQDECIYFVAGKGKCSERRKWPSELCDTHCKTTCEVCGGQALIQCQWDRNSCGANLCKSKECFAKHKLEKHNE